MRVVLFLFFSTLLFAGLPTITAQMLSEELFKNPPKETRPRTWMHAMSGNMSKAGLTKDLEAMAEVGIGGLLLFNVTQGIPNGPVKYNSPEHHELLKHAAKESERLGLSFGVHNCDGWSSSGGPWVTPEQSMKMVVWSEQMVKGGGNVTIQLAQPTTREGLYRDIAVLAYPSLPAEILDAERKPVLTASDNETNTVLLNDGRWDAQTQVKKKNENPWVQFDYGKPHTIRSVYMIHTERSTNFSLATSADGVTFRTALKLKKVRTGKGEWANNVSFDPITARYFRIVGDAAMTLKEISLSGTLRLDNPLGRTAIARTEAAEFDPIGVPNSSMIIDKNKLIDLSGAMDASGLLQTDLPAGNWTIMRFGYTSTSASNNPASVEGKGLEVDKLSRPAFKNHYDAFVKKVIDASKPVAPNALQYIEIDSYEMGGQNWTDDFETIFRQAHGYDLRPFLPLVAGRFVESAIASEAVLDDYRGLVCDLMTKNYFAYFQELCHADGLKTYIEPYGFGPLNDLDVGKAADMPMGEFWMNRPITQVASAVSAAHIYGRPVISAESFTAEQAINWKGHPAIAKLSGDRAWALGINEFMFHRFAHQANTHTEPGMTMNRWGSHFDRTQTWWKSAGAAWFTYIARGSYLLRQGVPVNDLLVFVGDGSPNSTVGRRDFSPNLPRSIGFDCVNADVLLNRITCADGDLVLPEGTRYRALVLANSPKIKLTTLRRLHELSQQGIMLVGPKPQELLGYQTTNSQRNEFATLVEAIWKQPDTEPAYNWAAILKKRGIQPDFTIEGQTESEFIHRKTGTDDLYFLVNADTLASETLNARFRVAGKIPELWNPMTGNITKVARFSEANGITTVPVTLNAQESVFVIFRESSGGVATAVSQKIPGLDVRLNAQNQPEAVIFQNGTYPVRLSSGKTWTLNVADVPAPMPLLRPWQVQFNRAQGFGGTLNLTTLTDWAQHPNDSVRHYSGTATYTTTFQLSRSQLTPNTRLQLDLGAVNIVASVKMNGKACGVSWMAPFVVDITGAVQPGQNTLEVAVTNQWSNRLIGDERYEANDGGYKFGSEPTNKMPAWYVNNEPRPAGQRTTFTIANFYKATDPLLPSGLLGPVRVIFSKTVLKQ